MATYDTHLSIHIQFAMKECNLLQEVLHHRILVVPFPLQRSVVSTAVLQL